LGEDNSAQIKVHPELSSVSARQLGVRVLATESSGQEHANAPIEAILSEGIRAKTDMIEQKRPKQR